MICGKVWGILNKNKSVLTLYITTMFIIFTMFPQNIKSISQINKTEAEICEILGILKGEGYGVTEEYLSKKTQRLQAAILTLRLFGGSCEKEALEYKWTDNFKDASDVLWLQGKNIMAYLKKNPQFGWRGDQNGKFNPNGEVTPQMMYKILLEALGYKQDYGNGGDFKWEEVLDFAFWVGLWDVSYKDVLTNRDVAIAIVEALQIPMKDSKKTLLEKLIEDGSIDRNKAIEAGLIKDYPLIVSVKEVDLGVVDVGEYPIMPSHVTVTLNDGTKKEASVVWEKEIDNTHEGIRTIIGDVEGTDIKAFATVKFVSKPLEVLDISADNLIEINVKFNKPIDVIKAKNRNNYNVKVDDKNIEIKDVLVSKDRKTATLCLSNAVEQQKKVQVTVKKEIGIEKDTIRTIDSILDIKLPEVEEIKVLGNRKIHLKFSEPVVNADISTNYIINNGTLQGYVTRIDNRVYVLNIINTLSYGKHTLVISRGVQDYAKYPLKVDTIEFEVVKDERLPDIDSIISATQTMVVVRFNKPVEPLLKEKIVSADGAKVTDIRYQDDFQTYEIEFERTAAIREQGTEITIFDVLDYYGNRRTIKINVIPVVDKQLPFFIGYKVKDQDKIILEFSKDVVPTGATYVLKDSSGEVININQVGWHIDEAGNIARNKVVLQRYRGELFEPGNYTLNIQDVVDYTPRENRIVPVEISIKIIDNISPEVKEVKIKDKKLFIIFNEKLNYETAITKNNYSYLNFSNYVSVKLPDETVIELLPDKKTVAITFPEKFDMRNIDVLQISSVCDLAGNVMNPKGILAPFGVVDSPPKIMSVSVTGKNTIVLTLSKDINPETLSASDFVVMAGTEHLSIKAIDYDTSSRRISLTLYEYLSSSGQYEGKDITVMTSAGNIKTSDFYGQPIQGLAPTKVEDKFPPYATGMIIQSIDNNTNIIISLNENIRSANGSGKQLSSNELSQFIVLVDEVVRQVISSKYETSTSTSAARITLTIAGNHAGKKIRVLFFAGPNNTLTDYAPTGNPLANFELP
ncbi:MAG: Ig-like domain-containing protein [Firmicutes bacterium]|nr:Ig-like domain-containing protein [Bacillota bacterium]